MIRPATSAHAIAAAAQGSRPRCVCDTNVAITIVTGSSDSRPAAVMLDETISAASGSSTMCGFHALTSSSGIRHRYSASEAVTATQSAALA